MTFDATLTTEGRTAVIAMTGTLDAGGDDAFREKVERASGLNLAELVLDMSALEALSSAGLRALVYARQQMPDEVQLVISSPGAAVRETLRAADFDDSVAIRG